MGVKFSELPKLSSSPNATGDYFAILHKDTDDAYKLYKTSINHALSTNSISSSDNSSYYGFGSSTTLGHVAVKDATDVLVDAVSASSYTALKHSDGAGLIWSVCAASGGEMGGFNSSARTSHTKGSFFYIKSYIAADLARPGDLQGRMLCRAKTNISVGDILNASNVETISVVELFDEVNSRIDTTNNDLTDLRNSIGSLSKLNYYDDAYSNYFYVETSTGQYLQQGIRVLKSSNVCMISFNQISPRYAFNTLNNVVLSNLPTCSNLFDAGSFFSVLSYYDPSSGSGYTYNSLPMYITRSSSGNTELRFATISGSGVGSDFKSSFITYGSLIYPCL